MIQTSLVIKSNLTRQQLNSNIFSRIFNLSVFSTQSKICKDMSCPFRSAHNLTRNRFQSNISSHCIQEQSKANRLLFNVVSNKWSSLVSIRTNHLCKHSDRLAWLEFTIQNVSAEHIYFKLLFSLEFVHNSGRKLYSNLAHTL